MPILLPTLLNFQGSARLSGVGSFSYIFEKVQLLETEHEIESVVKRYQGTGNAIRPNRWIVKKIIQKMIPQFVAGILLNGKTVGKSFDEQYVCLCQYAYSQMMFYSKERLETIGKKRFQNYWCLCNALESKNSIVINFQLRECEIPYGIQIHVENEIIRDKVMTSINKIGMFCFKWPLLPDDIDDKSNAYDIKNKGLIICVHEDIPIGKLIRSIKKI